MPKKANLQERGQEMNTAISDTRTVKISEATTLITRAFKKKRPVFLWGPPGIGKSELVQGIGDSGALGNTVIDMRHCLSQRIRGYPFQIKNGKWFGSPIGRQNFLNMIQLLYLMMNCLISVSGYALI